MILKLVLIFAVLVFTHQSQYVPIPKTMVGIPFGNPSGKINIELIYDPVCTFFLM